MRLPIARFVLDGFPVFGLCFRKTASALQKISAVVVRARVVRIDVDGFPESVLGELKFFDAQEKHSVIIVTLRRARMLAYVGAVMLLRLLELTHSPIQL